MHIEIDGWPSAVSNHGSSQKLRAVAVKEPAKASVVHPPVGKTPV
jgi:hypothetical protein